MDIGNSRWVMKRETIFSRVVRRVLLLRVDSVDAALGEDRPLSANVYSRRWGMTLCVFHLPMAMELRMVSCAYCEFESDFRFASTSYDHFVRSYFMRIECSFRSWRRVDGIMDYNLMSVCLGRHTNWSRRLRERYWMFTNAELASLRCG